jgi:glycosyltransferase involved in cell wall biosynthesis/spore maturation protein CgeB
VNVAAFHNAHAGETIIVCGCGESLNLLEGPERFITIGVNDVGRKFDPTYLVVLNPRQQFAADRFRYVEQSRARFLFTQLDLGLSAPPVVKLKLGEYGGTSFIDPAVLHYTRNSPYVASCLAAHMGAARIGLIGVDFTDDHFFARTGAHALARRVPQIDREYARLADALRARGTEIVNLSPTSRLTALPRADLASFTASSPANRDTDKPETPLRSASRRRRVFFVHYRFLTCGDVFTTGLERAADAIGVAHAAALWDDAALPEKIRAFAPDLVFVVHGRRAAERWRGVLREWKTAVWLVDEPYEVDDTARWSNVFDTVFVNDPATLARHRGAHLLPVCFDPLLHRDLGAPRPHRVGFIGGYNRARERVLARLAEEGLLSYVVGGPWQAAALQRLRLADRTTPAATAELYQQTQIVLNVFRSQHHFNRAGTPATSLNPRVYEALACGALVVSEERPERASVFPELPSFADAAGCVAAVRHLLAHGDDYRRVLAASRARLAAHTYAERLRTALAIALPEDARVNIHGAAIVSDRAPSSAPAGSSAAADTSVLMVVHGGLAMTRVSVLRTLRHSAGARLVVVDNASTDGTREWLQLLARRGDIDLIESAGNGGHGPGLELARRRTRSPYLVTLDSDAFPLADDWLDRLRARLDAGAAAAGILHHREYIHPSCLMIARRTLDDLGLTFLDEKDRPSRLDVAERISVELRRRGRRLAGLERTAARRRGSRAEPVFLGSTYEGLVYHQWYTTRAAGAPGRPVDDVPREALDRSLAELLDEDRRQPRDATIIVGLRIDAADTARRRNAIAVLTALNFQDLGRFRYRIVVVEQGIEPRLATALAPLVDEHLFAGNAGAYNRGWAFNVGVKAAALVSGPVCLLDGDLLVPPDFVSRGLAAMRAGTRALLPFRTVRYLDAADSARVIAERLAAPASRPALDGLGGRTFGDSEGGALWLDAALYRSIGGYDERFRGWGCEDREICRRLERAGAAPSRLDECLLHLDHPRPAESDAAAHANQQLLARLARAGSAGVHAGFDDCGDPDRYVAEATPGHGRVRAGYREWEHWNAWKAARIDAIVGDETALPPAASSRRALADLAGRIGSRMLDVGCGPAALWPHITRYQPRLRWVGSDVTATMLAAARRRFPDAPLVQADAGQLPWQTGSFDVVVLRHVLEHLPPWLMTQALGEACRVASRGVLLAFSVPPSPDVARQTRRVGEGFLETRWTVADIERPLAAAGWVLRECRRLGAADGDQAWIVAPEKLGGELFLFPEAAPDQPDACLKISIVMPTYRRGHRLRTTVDTVLAQTYRHWELIIVDNGGDCDVRFADPRIRVHVHAERPSAAHARNLGLRYATGDLVCFFDDDDEMFPDYLERFVTAFRNHPGAKMVRCGMVVDGGRVNYSYATPEVCLRRQYAVPSWAADGPRQDQLYFGRIVTRHRWSEARQDIVVVRAPLCRAVNDPRGGLRAGRY